MNQNAAAEWDLNFTQRIARVIGLNMLAGDDIMIINPGAIRRNPLRIEDNLIRIAQAGRQLKFIAPNTDAVGFNFLSVLPKRQLESDRVDGNPDVRIAGLQARLFKIG